jgi:uncharacterized protein YlxW (UPF0749 family)
LTAVAVLMGFLVVVQFRAQQADGGLSGLTSQELTLLVANLSNRNGQLRSEVAALEGDLRALDAARARGQSSLDQIRRDLERVRAWAGLDPVVGAGVRLRASGSIEAPAVEQILNELRNAGAEAIAVGGIRVVWGTVVSEVDGRLTVESVPLSGSVEILAIGNPEILTGSLTRVGGVISLLGATSPEVDISVEPLDRIQIPATTRDLTPAHGSPRL